MNAKPESPHVHGVASCNGFGAELDVGNEAVRSRGVRQRRGCDFEDVVALQELFIDSFMTTSGWQIDGYTLMISSASHVWTFEALKAVEAAQIANEHGPQEFALLAKHGIEPLEGRFDAKAIEGPANSVIIFRADSEEASRAFYDDPEYADAKKLRRSITSNATMITAPSFRPTD